MADRILVSTPEMEIAIQKYENARSELQDAYSKLDSAKSHLDNCYKGPGLHGPVREVGQHLHERAHRRQRH